MFALKNYMCQEKMFAIKNSSYIKLLLVMWKVDVQFFFFTLKKLWKKNYNKSYANQNCDINNFHIYKQLIIDMTIEKLYEILSITLKRVLFCEIDFKSSKSSLRFTFNCISSLRTITKRTIAKSPPCKLYFVIGL